VAPEAAALLVEGARHQVGHGRLRRRHGGRRAPAYRRGASTTLMRNRSLFYTIFFFFCDSWAAARPA
jgi:hypothetical protein